MIKFLDIYKQDKHIHSFIINKIRKLFKKGDFILGDEVKKVIVFKFQNQVHIYKCEEDIPEGNAVTMDTSSFGKTEE